MTTTAELVTVPSADTPGTCIFIHHEKRSYVFGRVADGTQRAFTTRKISLSNTEHIFLSGPAAGTTTGGLLGYLLSVGAIYENSRESVRTENEKRKEKGLKPVELDERKGISVHGGDNLCHVMAAYRAVIMRQGIRVKPIEHRGCENDTTSPTRDADWQDDAVRVWKIPVQRASSGSPCKRPHDSVDAPDNKSPGPTGKVRSALSSPAMASLILERIMFNGDLKAHGFLPARKVCDLKPDDVAVVYENKVPKIYVAGRESKISVSPQSTAYVFEEKSGSRSPGRSEDAEGLTINATALPPTCYSQTSTSYIFKCRNRRGRFNPSLATELGVEKFDFKFLTQGQTVMGKDGKEVTPDMVLGETQPGQGIIVADIPSHDFIEPFLARPEWQSAELMDNIAMMFWLLGPGLSGDARIQAFMQKHTNMKHTLCAEDTCPNMIIHTSPAELQVKLRRLDPERYPLPVFDNAVQCPAPSDDSHIQLGRAGIKMQLMPRVVHIDESVAPFPNLDDAVNEVDGGALQLAQKARTETTDPDFLARIDETEKDIPSRDAEIIPLGTGSSIPSKYRNVSGTLIRVPGIGNYLLDCGEGTLGQIRRLFGPEETKDVLRNLRCIVISHLHADHHMGLALLIKAWYEQALEDKSKANLAISCISRHRILIEELAQVEDIGLHRLRFPSCAGRWRDRTETTAADLAGGNFGLASILRVPVTHCWRSHAVQLELTSGLRVAYSGDCRPSKEFAAACKGAHLLVHECTFDDDRADHARHKRHSTMGEALGVARDMRARRVLLTHFSQRYTKADSLSAQTLGNTNGGGDGDGDGGDGGGVEQKVLLATDMMRVRLGEFQQAARYVPAVQALLANMGD